jgi:dsDNA-specific endonuclease/ATPase MutS2
MSDKPGHPERGPGGSESKDGDDVAVLEITDELDLHTFRPAEVADVVEEYLHEAQRRGFATVRIVHGKGIGNLRRTVHAVCERHPAVASYRLAGERAGSWGATLVELVLTPATGRAP